jgi:hypothetical protein
VSRIQQAADEIKDAMAANPEGITRAEIECFMTEPHMFKKAVERLRLHVGRDVVVCQRSKTGQYLYLVAEAREVSDDYLRARKVTLRSGARNLATIADRAIARFGANRDVVMTRALLESVVRILDADEAPV